MSLLKLFTIIALSFTPLFAHIPTSQKIKTRIIINPHSGTTNKENIENLLPKILDSSKFDYEICYTERAGHATELSHEAASLGYELVIAIGGDGTVNEVGKGLIETNTAMGIIPSGSGNGLARHLKIPSDPKKALQILNQFKTKSIDTVKINNSSFLGVAGIGFDAHIAWKFAKSKRRGFWSYAKLVMRDYFSYTPPVFEMEIDGESVKKEGLLISFANSSQYGNDIMIAPHSKIDNGHLHLVTLKDPSFYHLPTILRRLRNGTITHSKYYESICCKEIIIREKNILAHIDGEPAFFENGLRLQVLPKSLKVVVPAFNSLAH